MNPITQEDLPFQLGLPCNYRVSNKGKLEIETLKDQESTWKIYAQMFTFHSINCLTQRFGTNYNNFYQELGLVGHNGLDFKAFNNSFLYAMIDGTVVGWSQQWGGLEIETKVYRIKDQDVKFRIVYGHLDSSMVTLGDEVKKGDNIGFTNNRGQYTTGPHLHVGFYPYYKTSRGGWARDTSNGYGGAIDFERNMLDLLAINYDQPMKHLKTKTEIVDEYIRSGGVLGVSEADFVKVQNGDMALIQRIKDNHHGMLFRPEKNGEFYALQD